MRSIEQQNLALACLQLAANTMHPATTADVVASASQFLAFVTGESRDAAEERLLRVERAFSQKPAGVASA